MILELICYEKFGMNFSKINLNKFKVANNKENIICNFEKDSQNFQNFLKFYEEKDQIHLLEFVIVFFDVFQNLKRTVLEFNKNIFIFNDYIEIKNEFQCLYQAILKNNFKFLKDF